jgi:hypothetical protein
MSNQEEEERAAWIRERVENLSTSFHEMKRKGNKVMSRIDVSGLPGSVCPICGAFVLHRSMNEFRYRNIPIFDVADGSHPYNGERCTGLGAFTLSSNAIQTLQAIAAGDRSIHSPGWLEDVGLVYRDENDHYVLSSLGHIGLETGVVTWA